MIHRLNQLPAFGVDRTASAVTADLSRVLAFWGWCPIDFVRFEVTQSGNQRTCS